VSTKTIVKRKADDFKAGMDWYELKRFAEDAAQAVRDHADRLKTGQVVNAGPVRCSVNMRGGIKELSVEVVTDD
jgi:hypothetical protein